MRRAPGARVARGERSRRRRDDGAVPGVPGSPGPLDAAAARYTRPVQHLPDPPDHVTALARARADARAVRDWATADARKAEIEAAGWKVIDRGLAFDLVPAAPPTVVVDGVVRYGSSDAVPSRLAEPASAAVTVVLVADERPNALAAMLAALGAHAPAGTHVVIVANDPAAAVAERLTGGSGLPSVAGETPEVAWTSARLGAAAALNAGLARARGAIVVFADGTLVPAGDALTQLVAALGDPAVAVVGAEGRAGTALPRLAPADGPNVDVVGLSWLAFRREDGARLGPLDEKLVAADHVDAWWSLCLRAGTGDDASRGARRLDLPLVPAPAEERTAADGAPAGGGADAARQAKRNAYRLLDRFRDRPDLLSGR